MIDLPHGLPSLPLPGAPDGDGADLYVVLKRDRYDRWVAHLFQKLTRDKVDQLEPEESASDALMAVARNYPRASYHTRAGRPSRAQREQSGRYAKD